MIWRGAIFAIAALAMSAAIATSANESAPAKLADKDLDSPAAQALRKVPKEILNGPNAKRFSIEAKYAEEEAARKGLVNIDEIRVFGQRDPDDIAPRKKAPMQVLREKLERDRPLTPAQKAQIVLCLFGLCAMDYGPEGIPVESKAFTRGELGGKSLLELSKQFHGTLQ